MADTKTGTVIYRQSLSQLLEIFRIHPEPGSSFPEYLAGQNIALSREQCKLTKKVLDNEGRWLSVYDLDEAGIPKRGRVTRSYSIASSPIETRQKGYLEFYVALELINLETPGQLSESLFQLDPGQDDKVTYENTITGDFTLEQRAAGFESVVMVASGTGLAPFVSMLKQLYSDALEGTSPKTRYTLIHANRTFEELGYHSEISAIEASRAFNFVYVPSVSRPTQRDHNEGTIGIGRANNILRSVFDMATKEGAEGVRPLLPRNISKNQLLERMDPARAVILACGNTSFVEDIQDIARRNHIRFEKEEW